ncbi:MAG: DNA polymerase I [Bacilli bacterium]|nr:DNA polymerase I [Bacilli bacterium]
MNKIILVDGNNLLFRSYYATAYNGNFMKNSKGLPTNALFGFTNMMNKIILEEKPTYILVAFDKGKTFRHEKYADYKGGRSETPDELKVQFPIAKELLTYMGIKYYEIDNYEADDIIGTFASYCDKDPDFIGTIISSDKDLLQLISNDIDIKLLKQKDYIRYNRDSFKEEYGIEPINIIDLKALMGDPSDNIPGVKGIGEKGALKLLQEYKSLDGIYENIDKIKGATHDKLVNDKEAAYMSYDLATIYKSVPMDININDLVYKKTDHEKLNKLYEDLEFFSFLKKDKVEVTKKPLDIVTIKNINELNIKGDVACYLEILGTNYHTAKVLGMGIYNKDIMAYIPFDILKENPKFLKENIKYTYDLKKMYVALKWQGIDISNVAFDTMIAADLLEYNTKMDIAYLATSLGDEIPFYENVYGKGNKLSEPTSDVIAYNACIKARFIYDTKERFTNELKEKEMTSLFNDIEIPLATVLGDMEYTGVHIDIKTLDEMGNVIKSKVDEVSKKIFEIAGYEFNLASPMQLGVLLFEELNLPHGSKKGKNGYSTSAEVLEKLKGLHPVVDLIMEYRIYSKLYSTYIVGLKETIIDNKIHTIYTQTMTRTGRLSSIEPNLQNIPIRYPEGKMIRKAFIPSDNSIIMSSDYSQVELRILSHIANIEGLIKAFKEDKDIHTKTASDIFKVKESDVTKDMRRMAKAVNFGIIYGISEYGLAENIGITNKEAKEFIANYMNTYPEINKYMEDTISFAHKNGYVKTLFGRIRNIPELENKNYMIRKMGERMALNTPIQGTSADIIKKAMVVAHQKIKENNLKSKMILQVHDELIFDVLESEKDILTKIIKESMESVVDFSVPLKVDIESGINWYEAK